MIPRGWAKLVAAVAVAAIASASACQYRCEPTQPSMSPPCDEPFDVNAWCWSATTSPNCEQNGAPFVSRQFTLAKGDTLAIPLHAFASQLKAHDLGVQIDRAACSMPGSRGLVASIDGVEGSRWRLENGGPIGTVFRWNPWPAAPQELVLTDDDCVSLEVSFIDATCEAAKSIEECAL